MGDGLVFANELLDNLPVRRLQRQLGQLVEHFVTLREGRLGLALLPATMETLGEATRCEKIPEEGQTVEVCLGIAPLIEAIAASLQRGALLFIDYMLAPAQIRRRKRGTLVGYRGGRVVSDPFLDPGAVDLTSHVDRAQLLRCAEAAGLTGALAKPQSALLADLGVDQEIELLQTDDERRRAWALVDPAGLGALTAVWLEK